ncbi:phasin family protein [Sphingobium terrigena]|uniref:Phasin family protein n=1 Tax=Sphingobium terrigena TaxID=2304063 RepID=A0A418YUJ9_9SPHN|nr:phasin family protein [Sphingobium terrigena]RJG55832.1 phasin family protein [Sphingobium terrigena]
MAVTPKTGRSAPRAKSASTTLSASEALKAAEAAIAPAPKKPAARKATASSVKAIDANPSAIVAATTAVDAPPEPELLSEPVAEAAPVAAPEPVVEEPVAALPPEAPAEPEMIKSLPKQAEPFAIKTLSAIEGTKTMNDVIETGKKFAEDAKAKLETVYADLNEKAKVSVEKSTKAIEEFSDIAKGNVEALVESGKIAAKGMETLGQEAVDYSRKSFEKATASFKTFSTIKTPTEFFQLQSQLFSSSFDDFTKEAAKSSEAMMKLAGDVASPLTARVTLVTDKVKSLAA